MTKANFTYGKYSYDYFLIRRPGKTMSLTVWPDLKIVVKSPFSGSAKKIDDFLKRKWIWLDKQIAFFSRFRKKTGKKSYISGESFLYLGRQYKLAVKKSKTEKVALDHGIINVFTGGRIRDGKRNRKLLDEWYARRTKIIFNDRLKEAVKQFSYDFFPEPVIKKMDKRWGSYVSGKRIILNPKLIQAPRECIDYVITHELCHMTCKRHDKRFFKLLESKMPEWKKVKERLEMRFYA